MAVVERSSAVIHRFNSILRWSPKQFTLRHKPNFHLHSRLFCASSTSRINLWEEYKVLRQTTDGNETLPYSWVHGSVWAGLRVKRGIILCQKKCWCNTLTNYLGACHLMQVRSLSWSLFGRSKHDYLSLTIQRWQLVMNLRKYMQYKPIRRD